MNTDRVQSRQDGDESATGVRVALASECGLKARAHEGQAFRPVFHGYLGMRAESPRASCGREVAGDLSGRNHRRIAHRAEALCFVRPGLQPEETKHRTGLGSATPLLHPWVGLAIRGIVLRVGLVAALLLLRVCGAAAADKPAVSKPAAKTFEQANKAAVKNAKEPVQTFMGLKQNPGFEYVLANCIGCHSPRLIAQHHLSRKRWEETLVTMNKKHGLWKLSPDMKAKILDYLAENQGPLGDQEFKETPWAQPLYRPNPIW